MWFWIAVALATDIVISAFGSHQVIDDNGITVEVGAWGSTRLVGNDALPTRHPPGLPYPQPSKGHCDLDGDGRGEI